MSRAKQAGISNRAWEAIAERALEKPRRRRTWPRLEQLMEAANGAADAKAVKKRA